MTFQASEAGWCVSYGRPSPHWSDLLVRSNAPFPMCQACTLAWLRDDGRTDER